MQSGIFIKVGIAKDIQKRLEAALLWNPIIRLVMYRTVSRNAAPGIEKRIHELLGKWHHCREWFTAPLGEVRNAAKVAIAEAIGVERRDYALARIAELDAERCS